jgi:hypothetical protein
MNSLWDDWFVDPFLSKEKLAKKYGPPCSICGREVLKFPYCSCEVNEKQKYEYCSVCGEPDGPFGCECGMQ